MRLTPIEADPFKVTKASVGYSKGMSKSHCGICEFYKHGACTKVQGSIDPAYWCRLFKKQHRAEGGPIYRDDGGMTLQRTAPFPDAPEGFEFYGPPDEPVKDAGVAPPSNDFAPDFSGAGYGTTAGIGPGNTIANAASSAVDWYKNQPSWMEQAQKQSQKDIDAYTQGGVGAMFDDTHGAQDLAGGFAGSTTPAVGAASAVARPFYSAVERAISETPQPKASGEQWLATLRNRPGVKPEEMEWTGLDDWLKEQKSPVTKQQVADYVRDNQVQVQEVMKGDAVKILTPEQRARLQELEDMQQDGGQLSFADHREYLALDALVDKEFSQANRGNTKFSSYTLPGGENYRELLLTLPDKASPADLAAMNAMDEPARRAMAAKYPEQAGFQSPHFDEPNVLAHIRFNDRTIDGKKTLFVEEVQSDWHQKGKREGYKEGYKADELSDLGTGSGDPNMWYVKAPDNVFVIAKSKAPTFADAIKYIVSEKHKGGGNVPDAPFKTTWPELAMKRIIRYAAENGYDKVAWTPGSVQEARYWGHEAVAPAVARWNEATKPHSIRELSENVLGRELTAMMPLKEMEGGVLSALHHNEIRREVISRLPVNVVNDLASIKASPEQFFRNPDVVVSRLSPNHRRPMAEGLFAAISETGTALRAKLRSLKETGGQHLLTPTFRASELNTREVAGLLDPQRLFHGNASPTVPEATTTAGAGAKPSPSSMRGKGGGELSSAELAEFLNAHASINGNEGLLRQGVQPPPGEGMRGFYDQMLPAAVNKLVKKHGARVQMASGKGEQATANPNPDSHGHYYADLPNGDRDGPYSSLKVAQSAAEEHNKHPTTKSMHSLDITPSLRKSAMEQGFPQFAHGGAVLTPVDHNPFVPKPVKPVVEAKKPIQFLPPPKPKKIIERATGGVVIAPNFDHARSVAQQLLRASGGKVEAMPDETEKPLQEKAEVSAPKEPPVEKPSEKTEPAGPTVMEQLLGKMIEVLQEQKKEFANLAVAVAAPKKLVRDENNNITGSETVLPKEEPKSDLNVVVEKE